jgi:uncharacterized protein (TIGR00730 family)
VNVTVFGSARVGGESKEYKDARALGALLAKRGDTIVSGGYGGVMEAVSRGAREAGGRVLGVTVAAWAERLSPNVYLDEERPAATLFERLKALVESDALIALPGGAGTLGEVALAWNLCQMQLMPPKLIILVGEGWRRLVEDFSRELIVDEADLALLTLVENIEEAVAALTRGASQTSRQFG